MSLKNIFKAGSITFKKYSKVLIPIVFAMSILLVGVYILGSLLSEGLGFVFAFIILLPCLVGLKNVARKCVLREDTDSRDFYFGFKYFGASLRIETSTLIYALLYFIIGFFAGAFLVSAIFTLYCTSHYPDFISMVNMGDMEAFSQYFATLPIYEPFMDVLFISSIFFGMLAFIWKGLYRQYVCYITMDAPFTLIVCYDYSKKFLKKNDGKFFTFNLLFGLYFVISSVGCHFLSKLFLNLKLNDLLNVTIVSLIFFLLISIMLVYYMITSYHSYNHYCRQDIIDKFKKVQQQLDALNIDTVETDEESDDDNDIDSQE